VYALLIGAFAFIIASDVGSGATSSVIVGVLLLALIVYSAAAHFRPVSIVPGRSLGGGPLKRIDLMPEESSALELAECGLTPKSYGRLFLTEKRLIFLPGAQRVALFQPKPVAFELGSIVDIVEARGPRLTRWLYPLQRVRVITERGPTDFWPLFRGSPSQFVTAVRDALIAQGWRPRES
jgi:hypothetical protein